MHQKPGLNRTNKTKSKKSTKEVGPWRDNQPIVPLYHTLSLRVQYITKQQKAFLPLLVLPSYTSSARIDVILNFIMHENLVLVPKFPKRNPPDGLIRKTTRGYPPTPSPLWCPILNHFNRVALLPPPPPPPPYATEMHLQKHIRMRYMYSGQNKKKVVPQTEMVPYV